MNAHNYNYFVTRPSDVLLKDYSKTVLITIIDEWDHDSLIKMVSDAKYNVPDAVYDSPQEYAKSAPRFCGFYKNLESSIKSAVHADQLFSEGILLIKLPMNFEQSDNPKQSLIDIVKSMS